MPDIFVAKKEKKIKKKSAPKKKKTKAAKKIPKAGQHPLAAYVEFPTKVSFETQKKEEKVVLLLRRHPITNLPWIIIALFMLFAPGLLSLFPVFSFLPARFQLIAVIGWYLGCTAFILENFLIWFFNVNIITDERIIDIDFYNLIYKEVSDAKIDKIQDVTYKMGGVVRTIFNYGDVLVQTAAEVPNFDFLAVPRPNRVAKRLQELIIEEEKEKLEGRVR